MLPPDFLLQIARAYRLSPQQRAIFLRRFSSPKSERAIASELHISRRTLDLRLAEICEKFSLDGRQFHNSDALLSFLKDQYQNVKNRDGTATARAVAAEPLVAPDRNGQAPAAVDAATVDAAAVNAAGAGAASAGASANSDAAPPPRPRPRRPPLPLNSTRLEDLLQPLRDRCAAEVLARHGRLTLLNGRQADTHQWSLDVYLQAKLARESYAHVTELLIGFDQQRNFERFGLAPRQERLSGLAAAARFPRLMVLGRPGAGKSILLRSLATACARGDFLPESLPLLIHLPDLLGDQLSAQFSLAQYIQEELGLSHSLQAERVLNCGRLLLLLDGLDELPEQFRRQLQQQVRDFALKYSNNRFVISSHTQFTDYSFPTFEYVEIAELSDQQVAEFSRVWFAASASNPEQVERQTQGFLSRLRSPEASKIAAVAVTPTLLSFACFVYSELRILPLQLYDLYEYCLNFLLDLPPQADGLARATAYGELDLQQRYELMSHVAIATFEQSQFFYAKRPVIRVLAAYLDPHSQPPADAQVLLLARSRAALRAFAKHYKLLAERAPRLYSFVHLSLHEYLVERSILAHFQPENLDARFNEFIAKPWRSVFVSAANALETADELLLQVKRRIDAIISADKKLQIFLSWVNQKSLLTNVAYKPPAVRAFYFSQAVARTFEPRLARPLDFSHAVYRALKSDLHDRSLACQLDPDLDRALDSGPLANLAPDLLLDVILDCLLVTYAQDLDLFLTFARDRALKIDAELKQALQRFKDQLPATERDKAQWWHEHGEIWTRNLRLTIIAHRNIGYDWLFDEQQHLLLRQYLEANKLLVNCLDTSLKVSEDVREGIKATLLLPIAEIEKFRRGI